MTGRRRILAAAGGLLLPAAVAAARPARAQAPAPSFPSRPVTLVVGFPPGGLTDAMTRTLGQRLGQELGQPVVVDNRPGAGTSVANAFVAQARPDGHTLLMGSNSLATNPTALPHLPPRDPERDLAPVGLAYMSPFLLVVRADFPARTLGDFLAHARANPGRVDFASSGVGAVNHLGLALLNRMAGVSLEHVPYRGGAPALLDLRAGRVAAFYATLNDAGAQMQEGSLRALAVTSAGRLGPLPDVPAIAEALPGYEAVFWQGLFAPAGTPEPVVRRLADALGAATGDPALRAAMRARGVELLHGGPEALRDHLRREIETWARVIREADIKLE